MDSLVTEIERLFEETLTKSELNGMLTKNIRPVHWVDGIVSYFRIQKIIDLLHEVQKPLDPNLDVAITVLSGGRAKIRNQSHKDFCRDIKAKLDDLEGQTDEDLQQPVECLVPGCFPIGPECESLGISYKIFSDSKKSFPEAINPANVTNRVMFELSEYVTRVKESYESLARWIKKIMGWGDEYDLTPKMVEEWCATLRRDTRKKKKSSLSLAQKYLLEKFEFPGLIPNTVTRHGNEDVLTSSSKHPDACKEKTKLVNEDTSLIDIECSGDDTGDDGEEDINIANFLQDRTEVEEPEEGLSQGKDVVPKESSAEANEENDAKDSGDENGEEKEANKASTSQSSRKTSSRSAAKAALGKISTPEPKKQSPKSKGAAKRENNAKDSRERMDEGSDNEFSNGEEKEAAKASKSQSPRQTSSRSAAKAALGKLSTPGPAQRQSQRSKGAAIAPVGKKETRTSTSLKNTSRRAPPKKVTRSKVQTPARSTSRKRKLESSDESSNDDEDDDEEEEDEDDEDEKEDESSTEEGELNTSRKGKTVNTYRIRRDITEATKLFMSVSKVVNTLKKEMRIAMDYLESETAKICKNLQKAEKKLEGVMKMVRLDIAQTDSEDEEDESSEEEESEEEAPVKRTRGSQQTKKITVQVEPGVSAKLKKPLVKVTRIIGTKGQSRTPTRNAQASKTATQSTKTPTNFFRQNAGITASPRTSRSTRSVDTTKQTEEELQDFDKEKLFSSRVSVSLMKISNDLVKQALEKNDNLIEDSDEESLGATTGQGNSSSLDESAKKSARKNPSKRAKRKIDSDDEEEIEEDDEAKKSARKGQERKIDSDDEDDEPKQSARKNPQRKGQERKIDSDDEAKKSAVKNPPRKGQERNIDSDEEEEKDEDDEAIKSARRGQEHKIDSDEEEEKDEDPASDKNVETDEDGQESEEEDKLSNKTRANLGRFRSQKNVPRKTADLQNTESTSSRNVTSESSKITLEKTKKTSDCEQIDSDLEEDSTSKKPTRSSSRKSKKGTMKDKDAEVPSSDEEDKRPTRSSRFSRRTKQDGEEAKVDSEERSSCRSWRGRDKSPIENAKDAKASEIDLPYSGSEDEDIPKRSEPSAFAALAAGMSSFGDWRGASPKEKVKKRSLNDFVKLLNNPKRRKTDSGKKTSPRKKDVERNPDDKSSAEDSTESLEEQDNDDDFLEKQKSNGSTTGEKTAEAEDGDRMNETNGEEQADGSVKEFEMESQGENEPPEGDGEHNHSKDASMDKDIQAVKQTRSRHKADTKAKEAGSDKEFERESEKEDEFPGDSVVGKRIRHRCSVGKHGLYKWYEGTVVNKSSPSELLKLDEKQFGHLNNLYTFYTVKYDDQDELQAKALEYDWDRENLKFFE